MLHTQTGRGGPSHACPPVTPPPQIYYFKSHRSLQYTIERFLCKIITISLIGVSFKRYVLNFLKFTYCRQRQTDSKKGRGTEGDRDS